MLLEIASIIIGYLLGSAPVAYVIASYRKDIDIREVGVRNMGAANVFREVGKWEGILTLILDMGKGALSVYIAQLLGVSLPWVLGAGFAAVLGHNYPVYIGFRGGKGIAVVVGVFSVLSPSAMLGTGALIGIILLLTRNVFVAIEITSPFFLALLWYAEGTGELFFFAVVIVIFQLFQSRRRLKEIKPVAARMKNVIRRMFNFE